MPNAIAYLALMTWPLVVFALFRAKSPAQALIWSLLGGYLLLPPATQIDLPAIPPVDKVIIPTLAAWFAARSVGLQPKLIPEGILLKVLAVAYLLGPLLTTFTNGEWVPVAMQPSLPPLSVQDALAGMVSRVMVLMILALSHSCLRSDEDLSAVLRALMLAAMGYSLLMLVEIRLSPQINTWVYGFFQHSFGQMMREGGFRPIVFLEHGLWVAFFTCTAVLSAVALARAASGQDRSRLLMMALWLFVVLVLCKSLGSLIYTLALAPLIWLAPVRVQIWLGFALGTLAMVYPVLLNFGWFPSDLLLELAEGHSADRAQSLGYRFNNEYILIDRAWEKPLFGWGGYGRNLIFDPFDGRQLTVTDGRWIVTLGAYGWTGYLAEFGLLLTALARFVFLEKDIAARTSDGGRGIAALALLLGVNMVDLLPNATLTPLTWLVAGALLGFDGTRTGRASAPQVAEPKTII